MLTKLWLVAPIVEKKIQQLKDKVNKVDAPCSVDITEMVHYVMSEAMVTLLLGKASGKRASP